MSFTYDDEAVPITDFIFRSSGTSASYMVVTSAGRLIINTGMGFEAPHHKRLFDAVYPGPTPYIVTTQAHVDHVGGVATFREPGTRYVAQRNNDACQRDDARISGIRGASAVRWFGLTDRGEPGAPDAGAPSLTMGEQIARLMAENPDADVTQDRPTPDITFDERLTLRIGDLDVELISTPGGETIDSCVVWLPQHRICFVSNTFGPMFPHFPNFNTLRGDRYRYAEPYLAAVETVRALQPELLVTGRHTPIAGADLIDACLGRLHGAVDYVHRATLDGINAGTDVFTLMREIQLPDHLRVGQEYGRVSWAVRTFWESYLGWFHLRSSTELYPVTAAAAFATLLDTVGTDTVISHARAQAAAGEPVVALHLLDAVFVREPDHADARAAAVEAHEALLAAGEADNFWANGWLNSEIDRLRSSDDI